MDIEQKDRSLILVSGNSASDNGLKCCNIGQTATSSGGYDKICDSYCSKFSQQPMGFPGQKPKVTHEDKNALATSLQKCS